MAVLGTNTPTHLQCLLGHSVTHFFQSLFGDFILLQIYFFPDGITHKSVSVISPEFQIHISNHSGTLLEPQE